MRSAEAATALVRAPLRRSRDEQAFLPAALEIVEKPVTPYASAIGGTIIALFCIALAWACFGRFDIVATASGKSYQAAGPRLSSPSKPVWCVRFMCATAKLSKLATS